MLHLARQSEHTNMVLQNNYWFDIVPSKLEDSRPDIAGKWLVFGPTETLHALVQRIDALVESGRLPAAKIARKIPEFDPFPDSPCVLCAFTSDRAREKENVQLLLTEELGLETTLWKSDEQTARDWDTNGWLSIRAEINSIRKALATGIPASGSEAAKKRITELSQRLRTLLEDEPSRLSEGRLSGLQSSILELEAGLASRDSQVITEERMRSLEEKIDDFMRSLQSVMAKSVEARDEAFVFVVMPFSDPHVDTFDAIARAMSRVDARLTVQRVDQQPGAIAITDEIHRSLRKAGLVICDLTEARPNVYYELGYAKGIGQRLICVAREGTTIHFDAYGLKVLFFRTYRDLEERLFNEGRQLVGLGKPS